MWRNWQHESVFRNTRTLYGVQRKGVHNMRLVAFCLLFLHLLTFTHSVLQYRPDDNATDIIMVCYCFSLTASALYLLMS